MNRAPASATTQEQLVLLYRQAVARGIPVEEVDQKVARQLARLGVSTRVEDQESHQRERRLKKRLPMAVRLGSFLVPLGFLAVGLYLVGMSLGPIAWAYFSTGIFLKTDQLVSPIPRESLIDVTPLVISQVSADNRESGSLARRVSSPRIIAEDLDFTNLSNWFVSGAMPDLAAEDSQADVTSVEYTLEIPSLNIYNAKVKIGGTDLNASLIAYPGTALPGDPGAPVIFGHSILRQFYNPSEKNPNRYNSIFSTIMTLKNGDKIYVTHDDVRYTYMVTDKTEVQPEDVYILNQRYDVRQLKLVTCTPEGTYLRRGVITAQLVEVE
jgi:LPXTG-site transpeptidase (sortase) family protein